MSSKAGDAAGGALSGAAAGAAIGSAVPVIGTAIGAIGGGLIGGIGGWLGHDDKAEDQEARRKRLLYEQAAQAGGNAQAGFNAWQGYNQQGAGALAALQRQAMGQNSVSAEQLRQALQASQAQQQSMAAGASPQNAAMASRTAAIQSGMLASGLAGQQALAGLQERNQAQQQYGQLLGLMSGQAAQVGMGYQNAALTGYGAQNAGAPPPSWIQQWGPAVTGALSAYAQTKSDERAKRDLRDGDAAAKQATEGLKALLFAYRDPRDGHGTQLGTTAQNLERVGLGQAVVNTPAGKVIDAGKLSGANTAMIAALGRRVAELEDAGGVALTPEQVRRKRIQAQQLAPAAAAPQQPAPPDAAAVAAYRRKLAAQYALQLGANTIPVTSPPPPVAARPDPTARYWYMPDRGDGGSISGDAGGQ